MLLPSNHRKNVDYDLLVTQQARNIKISIIEIDQKIEKNQIQWKSFSFSEKRQLKVLARKYKREYIEKFNRIWKKQYGQIIANKLANMKKIKNRNDRERYKKRKAHKAREERLERADLMILNKSDYVIDENQKKLLLYGLNFAPTPKWTKKTEDREYLSLLQHIRRVEWDSVISDDSEDQESTNQIPVKLRIPKWNRPDSDLVEEKVTEYVDSVSVKLRNIVSRDTYSLHYHNNLNQSELSALHSLRKLVNNNEIVICKADKDGKIVIVNFGDYNCIMERELNKFKKIEQLTTDNIKKHLNSVIHTAEKNIIDLHKLGVIEDQLLKHTIGVKFYNGRGYQKIPGSIAKHFICETPGYSYPLFKTHKLTPEQLKHASIFDIPTRLLQSAGNITTSRITAFLEHILQPISVNFCQEEVNEYCRDSKHYLQELVNWKNDTTKERNSETLHIVAGDVKALYPSVPRKLVEKALHFALTNHSNFNTTAINILVKLTLFCLNNVIIQHRNSFFHTRRWDNNR